MNLVYYWRCDTTRHRQEFTSRDEALKFIAEAPKPDTSEIMLFSRSWCIDMKLDSTWILEQEADHAEHQ